MKKIYLGNKMGRFFLFIFKFKSQTRNNNKQHTHCVMHLDLKKIGFNLIDKDNSYRQVALLNDFNLPRKPCRTCA
jgi:hypothetical protein